MQKYVISTYTTKDVDPKTYLKFWYLLDGNNKTWLAKDLTNKKIDVKVLEYQNYETAKNEIFKTLNYEVK